MERIDLGRVTGKSAYEIAVDNGFDGTEQEWLESLDGSNYDDTELRNLIDEKSDINHSHENYVEKVEGKELSSNDFTDEEKNKLSQLKNYDDTEIKNQITDINKKIPTQATETNKLADKDFVNSSIATATAEFIGTYNSLTEIKNVSYDNNDYCFIVGKDNAGNTKYSRYKWNGSEWIFEYDLNNSSFTSEQWKAINSNVTDEWRQSVNTSISNKVDKVSGKGLSTNDFTNTYKTKLDGLSNYDDSALKTLINGKASTSHNHDSAYAAKSHTHGDKTNYKWATMVSLGFTKDSYVSVRDFWAKLIDTYGSNGVVQFDWANANQAYIGTTSINVALNSGTLIYTAKSAPKAWSNFSAIYYQGGGGNNVYHIKASIGDDATVGKESWSIFKLTKESDLTNWIISNSNYTGNPNDCSIGKWCSINTSENKTNVPVANGWATIITFAANNNKNYKQQLCLYSNSGNLYSRTCINGTWGSWVKFAKTSHLDSYSKTDHTHDDRYYTESEIDSKLSEKATKSVATTSENGLMSSTDKSKLNGIASGANKTTVDSSLSSSSTNPVQNKVVNSALSNKVDKVSGKGLSTNDFTTAEKNKLTGLSNYTHPTTSGNKHIPSGGSSGNILRWESDGTAVWGNESSKKNINYKEGLINTGDTWINGKTIYKWVKQYTNLPRSTSAKVLDTLDDFDNMISFSFVYNDGQYLFNSSFNGSSDTTDRLRVYFDNKQLKYITGSNYPLIGGTLTVVMECTMNIVDGEYEIEGDLTDIIPQKGGGVLWEGNLENGINVTGQFNLNLSKSILGYNAIAIVYRRQTLTSGFCHNEILIFPVGAYSRLKDTNKYSVQRAYYDHNSEREIRYRFIDETTMWCVMFGDLELLGVYGI